MLGTNLWEQEATGLDPVVVHGKEKQRVDVEPVEIAEKAAEKLKKRFEDYETPDGVPSDII